MDWIREIEKNWLHWQSQSAMEDSILFFLIIKVRGVFFNEGIQFWWAIINAIDKLL